MSKREYPFNRSGKYVVEWVEADGKSPVSSSVTVNGPIIRAKSEIPDLTRREVTPVRNNPAPMLVQQSPLQTQPISDSQAISLGFVGPYSKMQVPSYYRVTRGDSLSRIGQTYNQTVESLMKINGLTSDLIRVGQTLRLGLARHALGIPQ